MTRGQQENLVLVVTDGHDLDEARDALETILANLLQRRARRADLTVANADLGAAEQKLAAANEQAEPINRERTHARQDLSHARDALSSYDLLDCPVARDQLIDTVEALNHGPDTAIDRTRALANVVRNWANETNIELQPNRAQAIERPDLGIEIDF